MVYESELSYGRQWIDEADIAAVVTTLRGDWLTQGPTIARFEARLASFTGARHAVVVSSGTAALHLAGIAAGAEDAAVITAANTFLASATGPVMAGGCPSFADVDRETGLLDIADLERRCESLAGKGTPPGVVVPVDFAGQPPDLLEVRRIADRWGARVIEDAAHALGAAYTCEGQRVACASCTHTELSVLSFHPVKHITTGEGGAVLTNDAGVARRLRNLRSHGTTRENLWNPANPDPWYQEQQELGFNYRLTDLQCALGLSQLDRLEVFLERRRLLAARYEGHLAQPCFTGLIEPLRRRPGVEHAFHLYVVRVLPGAERWKAAEARRSLYAHLAGRGIRTQVHYLPVPGQPYFRSHWGTDPDEYSGCQDYAAGCLSLPLFPAMELHDVDRVTAALSSWLERRP